MTVLEFLRIFIFSYALTLGLNDGALYQYESDAFKYLVVDKPLFMDLNAEIQAGPFFIGGGCRTDFMAESLTSYSQVQDTYTVHLGARIKMSKGLLLEGGYRHSCFHPSLGYSTVYLLSGQKIATPRYEGAMDEFYITIKGQIGE